MIIKEFRKKYMKYFDRYVCTRDIRLGIKKIVKDIYKLDYNQVLFLDDVNTFAENAKKLNVSFIGIPASFPWGFQKQDIIESKVPYILNSVTDITKELLEKIDIEAGLGSFWN